MFVAVFLFFIPAPGSREELNEAEREEEGEGGGGGGGEESAGYQANVAEYSE